MPSNSTYIRSLLLALRGLREEAGLSPADLEERLILGPGWITRFEEGQTTPTLGMLLAIIGVLGRNLGELLARVPQAPPESGFERAIRAERSGNDLNILFQYGDYDATYTLPRATLEEFEAVVKTLRDGLSRLAAAEPQYGEAIKTDSVASAFLKAVTAWPHANPSDLWWFLISRAYGDPFNHPAHFARLDFTQSWKRTGGWALEEVAVRHYGPFLKTMGVNILIAPAEVKERLLSTVRIRDRLESDKIDVLLTDGAGDAERFFGVVHVKASFAERRTDDVPMSRALIKAGYASPLWTMDCKSFPSVKPINRGELGEALCRGGDARSAKRKDIEKDGYFSACFSYNQNTLPTPRRQKARSRIYVCDFNNPNDVFAQFIVEARGPALRP